LNKCYRYTTNTLTSGRASEAQPYKCEPTLVGDGDLSVFIVSQVLRLELNAPEYHAIRFHNVFEKDYQQFFFTYLQHENHNISYKLTWLIQSADMYASTVLKI